MMIVTLDLDLKKKVALEGELKVSSAYRTLFQWTKENNPFLSPKMTLSLPEIKFFAVKIETWFSLLVK